MQSGAEGQLLVAQPPLWPALDLETAVYSQVSLLRSGCHLRSHVTTTGQLSKPSVQTKPLTVAPE